MNPDRRSRVLLFALLLSFLASASVLAQKQYPTYTTRYEPQSSSPVIWNIGAGLGLPYGVIGGKLGLGGDWLSGDVGFGIVPLSWQPAVSGSAVLYLANRNATVRPKFTFGYSNAAAALVILEDASGSTGLDTIYDETFPGVGIYGGVDWRISKTAPFCLDLNIGWIFPKGGNKKIEDKYQEIVADLESQGYSVSAETLSLDTPKVSVGITYSPGRSQRAIYERHDPVVTAAAPDTTLDSDGDGVPDHRDREPNTPPDTEVDFFGVTRDDDGDGIPNRIDREPNTKRGMMVNQYGEALDADHDGVDDSKDGCPDTPADYAVNDRGCPIEVTKIEVILMDTGKFEENRIYFQTAQATLLPESFPQLDLIGLALSGLPDLRFEVNGHCDDRGTDEFNQRLSEDRARSVVDYLVGKFPGVSRNQFTARGLGKTKPVELGQDEASRAKNRRVEFVVLNPEAARQQVERKRFLQRGENADSPPATEPAPR
jgi:outer membrane protein OmpA-like peptidoglycan-associated protein